MDSRLAWKVPIPKSVKRCITKWNYLPAQLSFPVFYTLLFTISSLYISYDNIVWGNTSQSNFYKIKELQKKVIRIVTKCHFRVHSEPLFKQHNLLRIYDINIYQHCMFMSST